MEEQKTCISCQSSQGPDLQLTRCPICFRYFCDTCTVVRGGRPFCSANCAEFFFFGDEET